MLIVLVALVHLVNAMLGVLPRVAGAPVTLQRMLGCDHGAGLLADGHSLGAGARPPAR